MAEDYGVMLKITADTSDLEKIPQKVEATRKEIEQPVAQTVVEKREAAAPIEHPAEQVEVVEQREPAAPIEHPAETVKVDVEQPKPVKIEAKAEKIRIEVEDAEAKKRIEALTEKEGVKRIRVVTEGGELASRQGGKEIFELEVDAEKARETIAALKQDARIKVAADTSAAESSITGFFGRIRNGVTAVRRTLSTVFAGFGMVSFAVMGVMSLVAGFQKLRDMATATSRAIQQIRLDAWIGGFNAAADAMIGKHQKIIALLREEQDVANKAASLATMETSQDRAQEDASRQQVRSVQLAAATDPREQARLEQQFATEDAEIARRRFNEDKQRKLAQLDNEYSIYQSRATFAADQTGNVDREIANQENIVFRARKTIENGGDREKYDKVIEAAKKRIESLKDEKKALEDLQKTAQREADYRIKQIEIVEKSRPSQSSSASQQLAAARNAALDKEDQLAQSDFDRDRARRAADADFDARFRAAQRQASAPDATEQQRSEAENTQLNMLREREDQANAELQAAEKELAEEFKKDAKDRDEARMSRARENIREAETTAVGARRQREDLETNIKNRRVADAQDYFGNLARQIESSRPNDRLTAMGLSSGGSGDHTVREQADNVKLLVQLVRQQIAATKDINVNNTSIYAP